MVNMNSDVVKQLKLNPRDNASFASILTFWWIKDLLVAGNRKALEINDLYRPKEIDKSELLGDRLENQWHIEADRTKPSLLRCIAVTFWREIAWQGCMYVAKQLCVVLGQITFLGKLLLYFRNDSTMTQNDALFYGVGLIVFSGLNIIATHQGICYGYEVGMKIRIAVCSLIYRKLLQISHRALVSTSPGKLINILSNDVMRFDSMAGLIHGVWFPPLLCIIISVLLWRQAGWAGLLGLFIICLVAPIQVVVFKLGIKYRLQTAAQTDKRNQLMHEIVNGIRIIKMYTWEKMFRNLVAVTRRIELSVIKKNSYIKSLYMTFSMVTTRLALFCTMLTLVLTNEKITASQIFVILAYYELASSQMAQMFVRSVTEVSEAFGSIRRINTFLDSSILESKDTSNTVDRNGSSDDDEKERLLPFEIEEMSNYAISITNGHAGWDTKVLQLSDINLNLEKGKLIGVVGPVGSGKSTLLNVILKELPLSMGTLSVNGTIAFANQEPSIFCGTIKENILFGQELDELRYSNVLEICALRQDLADLPSGDATVIGERGVILSGGQKARISLARMAYFSADLYLLDDPLSAVDGQTGQHLFDNLIGPSGDLAKSHATRILVTHQIHFLKDFDWIIGLKEGNIEFQGTPSELDKQDCINFGQMSCDKNDERETNLCKNVYSAKIKEPPAVQNTTYLENMNTSKSFLSYLLIYFRSGTHAIYLIGIFLLFLISQISASFADWWVSFCIGQDEKYANNSYHQNGTINTHDITDITPNSCVLIHGAVVACLFVIALIRAIGFVAVCIRSSRKLHDGMFNGIIYTAIRFFDANSTGRILNRFSKDLGLVDETLPRAMLDAVQLLLTIIGSYIVTIIINYLNLFPLIVLTLILVYIRKLYLSTSTRIKELEGVTRSPVFALISESVAGLTTIRAYGAQQWFRQIFDSRQDLHTSVSYLCLSLSSAFGFYLDFLCWTFIAFVILNFVMFKSDILGHLVGLTITQALRVTGLMQWGVRQSAEIANHMMSVKRLIEYRDLEPEKCEKALSVIPKNWPACGKIAFLNVNFRYYEGAPIILKHIKLEIQPKEKIGIIGRTGAGKSSFINAILRLGLVEGEIFIDDLDVARVPLEILRASVSIIPQDPVLFSGTLRHNLDPCGKHSDSDLWKALEESECKGITGALGLEAVIQSRGKNFSVGEKQLICLARTILRRNKILILDEATANCDHKTDSLIQAVIRTKFSDCTVLTIAHRLNTIINSDRVAVIASGDIIEFGTPHELLQMENGMFNEMVETAGKEESIRLRQIVRDKFLLKRNPNVPE